VRVNGTPAARPVRKAASLSEAARLPRPITEDRSIDGGGNMTRAFRRGIIPLVALFAAGAIAACGDDDGGVGPTPTPTPLTDISNAALEEAFQDAYRTYYTYQVATSDFGNTAPFSSITNTELSYTNTLSDLYRSRGATPPASQWNAANVPRFQSLQQACIAAEEGEVATGMMFDRLLRLNLPDDLRQVFTNLRLTAREQHRLAFRNCAGGTIGPVSAELAAGMAEALQDEFHAYYTYQRVIDDIGSLAPFVAIHDAEWLHIGAASNLFVKRDMTVPASTWTLDNVPRFANLQAACAGGVDAEIENVMMYDRLLLQNLPADVERVFENLREASLERHLPAFEQCAGGGTAPVSNEVLAAMGQAIQDEYRAFFTYSGVVEDVDPDFPFGPIRDAEESHYTAIANLYVKRALTVPTSTWSLTNVPRFTTLVTACAAGVAGEIANIAMYDQLLALALPDDVKRVFEKLRAASQERHLPAFQACD
jgi:rubrerythrin